MKAMLALALSMGLSLSALAQNPQATEVSGHLMGQSAQEYCDHNYKDLNLKFLKKVCEAPSRDFTVYEGPVTPADSARAALVAAQATIKSPQHPPYAIGKSFFFKQGRLETVVVVFYTIHVSNSELALGFARQKYGEPQSTTPKQYQNGLGGFTTALNAEWSARPDGTRIRLEESLPSEPYNELWQTKITVTLEDNEQNEKIINPL